MPQVCLRAGWPAEKWERAEVDNDGQKTGGKFVLKAGPDENTPGPATKCSEAQLKAMAHHVAKGTVLVLDAPAAAPAKAAAK